MRCSDPSTVIQEGCRPDEKMREKWEYIEYIAKPLKKKKKKSGPNLLAAFKYIKLLRKEVNCS